MDLLQPWRARVVPAAQASPAHRLCGPHRPGRLSLISRIVAKDIVAPHTMVERLFIVHLWTTTKNMLADSGCVKSKRLVLVSLITANFTVTAHVSISLCFGTTGTEPMVLPLNVFRVFERLPDITAVVQAMVIAA